MNINEIISPDRACELVGEKLLSINSNGSNELSIYCYSGNMGLPAYSDWPEELLKLRGVIVDNASGEVIARGFDKFFNYGQLPFAHKIDRDTKIVSYDKADGSLLVTYIDKDDNVKFSTKGSLVSEVADLANDWAKDKVGDWRPPHGVTVLFEFVSPENRIVLDYKKTDFIMLGGINNETGEFIHPDKLDSPFSTVEKMPFSTVGEALDAQNTREDKEGFVVHVTEGEYKGLIFKLKDDEYLSLHRIITGYSKKALLECMKPLDSKKVYNMDDDYLSDWVALLPDELAQEVSSNVNDFWDLMKTEVDKARIYVDARRDDNGADKKSWALSMKSDGIDGITRSLIFSIVDGRDDEELYLSAFSQLAKNKELMKEILTIG